MPRKCKPSELPNINPLVKAQFERAKLPKQFWRYYARSTGLHISSEFDMHDNSISIFPGVMQDCTLLIIGENHIQLGLRDVEALITALTIANTNKRSGTKLIVSSLESYLTPNEITKLCKKIFKPKEK